MERLKTLLLRYPKSCLLLLALVTFTVGSYSRHTEFDASIKAFIIEDDPDYRHYNEYKQKFGQDDMLSVSFEAEDIFTPKNLKLIERLTERIADLDNIYDVKSLTNVEYLKGTEDSFEAVPLIDEIPDQPDESIVAARKRAIAHPIFRQDLISADGRKTSILVTLAAKDKGYRYHDEINSIRKIVNEESERAGLPIHFAGERYLDLRFLEYMHRDLKVFMPLTFSVLAILLFAMFRTVRETVIGLVTVGACLMWAGGLVPLTGWKMNPVTAGLPSLVLCIAVTDVIHIIHRYRKLLPTSTDREHVIRQTLREVTLPCLLTSLTTSVGFGSLILNEIHPIRGFGLLAAIGVGICFPVCIVMVPALLWLWKEPSAARKPHKTLRPGFMAKLGPFLIRRRKPLMAGIVGLLLLSLAGITIIKNQADRVRYLKKSCDVYKAVNFIEESLAGTTQLDIYLDSGKEGTIKEPRVLNKIEALSDFLNRQPEIDKVISINDFLKEMSKAFNSDDPKHYVLPQNRPLVAQFLLIYSMSGKRNELDKYVDYPYSRTRISVRTSEHNSAVLDDLIARINDCLAATFDEKLEARIASAAVADNNVFHYLVRGLLFGLGIAVIVVGLIMCLAFRSIRVGAVCMIPNLVPIIACLGLMGWCGIWLEIATAMTFSIALGIAVDDTIHLMSRFRLELSRHGDYESALRATLRNIGSALVKTTIVIMGGFLILIFASLKMNIMFGLLAAFVMLMTLFADLFVTPLCLLTFRPFALPAKPEGKRVSTAEVPIPDLNTQSAESPITEAVLCLTESSGHRDESRPWS